MISDIHIDVQMTGGPDLETAIANAFASMNPDLEGVLIEEGEEIMGESKEIVPVDQGILRDSGGHYGTQSDDKGVYVRYGYGGAAASYALIQHETPPSVFSHAEGRSWKYLEIPVFEAVQTMGPRMAGRLAARLAGRFSGVGGGGGSGATFGGE
jgi:hypothetical protein